MKAYRKGFFGKAAGWSFAVASMLLVAMSCSTAPPGRGNTGGGTGGASGSGTGSGSGGPGMCSAGFQDCGGAVGCANLGIDPNNCGTCGAACQVGQQCSSGACQCVAPLSACATGCVNTQSNPANCGDCGIACSPELFCNRGGCAAACDPSLTACGQACVDFNSDVMHCGNCETSCGTGQSCTSGVCTCLAQGQRPCGGVCTDVQNNNANCGMCGNPCGVGQTCVSGACTGGAASGAGGSGGTSSGSGGSGGTSSGSGGSGAGGAPTGDIPPGYWTYDTWYGCTWTGIDALSTSQTVNNKLDFLDVPNGGPYCVSGTVYATDDPATTVLDSYDAVALLGFNLAEPAQGADCSYQPVDVNAPGPPAVNLTSTGIAVNFSRSTGAPLRVQIQGPDGARDANNRWCYTINEPEGPIHALWEHFDTKCWEATTPGAQTTGNGYNNEPISAIVFLVPGAATPTQFEYCINGFAAGDGPEDAPEGGTGGPLMGTIGGSGSRDADFQRVKVSAGGKSYIIQNNNWGNWEGTDQTIQYSGNSFSITAPTGGSPGGGVPASFPSIYIGANGDIQGGLFATSENDMLPRAVNSISRIDTTFRYNRMNGDYNAAYDVWFSNGPPPAGYEDGVSGFLMVWFYRPPNNVPIGWNGGTPKRVANSLAGQNWNVYVGPRGNGSSAPVVSYIAQTPSLGASFDLMTFIRDSTQQSGEIQATWLLTDIFGGFEIWNGSGTQGLAVEEFTAVVTPQ
ncbi:MAG TPA: hypothetical protein VF989_21270 [Polyangiaceae bacterium]